LPPAKIPFPVAFVVGIPPTGGQSDAGCSLLPAIVYNGVMDEIDRRLLSRIVNLSGAEKLAFSVLGLVALVLMGCGQSEGPESIQHTRDVRAPDVVSMATATLLSPTEEPLRTAASSAPTVTPTSSGDLFTPSPAPCADDYFFDPSPAVCPSGAHQSSAAAEQPFERGFMIWLDATDSIYVFDWDGGWQQFEDTFEEGQQEYDPEIVPPAGKFQPVRGFGKVWHENPQVREQLGWALGRELGFDSKLQAQQMEEANPPVTFILTFNGQILALTSRTSSDGDWVLAAS
jgi:hypothetical protein